jgi:hypothetical protein
MFRRLWNGLPILFGTDCRYSEDYALWCRLSRIGAVVCPAEVVYRYRQHDDSITGLHRTEQQACFASIQRQQLCALLGTSVADDVAGMLSRFWKYDTSRSLADPGRVRTAMHEIESRFLSYVDGRYGRVDRLKLERDIDACIADRVSYWLYRSVRRADIRACRELALMARARGLTMSVGRHAVKRIVSSAASRVAPWTADEIN